MSIRGIVVTDDNHHPVPAIACVREFNSVIAPTLGAEVCSPLKGETPRQSGYDYTIYTALSYRSLVNIVHASGPSAEGNIRIAYVFDGFLSRRLSALPSMIRARTGYVKALRKLHVIFTPLNLVCEEYSRTLGVPHKFLPQGVDCVKYGMGGQLDKRWIQVNAYGRQPKFLTDALSDALNRTPGSFFFHTDHMRIAYLTDVDRYRAMFWQALRSSRIAVAYAPEAYDPEGRFRCSFIPIRWFESLAAGCMIVGKAPTAPEAGMLFDWDDATIELPADASDIQDAILDLLHDEDRLYAASVRNHIQCLSRHDWRHRLKSIVDEYLPELTSFTDNAASQARHLAAQRNTLSVTDKIPSVIASSSISSHSSV